MENINTLGVEYIYTIIPFLLNGISIKIYNKKSNILWSEIRMSINTICYIVDILKTFIYDKESSTFIDIPISDINYQYSIYFDYLNDKYYIRIYKINIYTDNEIFISCIVSYIEMITLLNILMSYIR